MTDFTATEPAPPRSAFVTGLGWTFIVLSGFSTLIALAQNVMLALLFPAEELRIALQEAQNSQPMPGLVRFMFEHLQFVVVGFLLLSIVTLVSSIGLLGRRHWARRVFIGLMGCGIAWNVVGAALPLIIAPMIPPVPGPEAAQIVEHFELAWRIMTVFSIVMALAFAILFGWIIKRLLSNDIRNEFG